MLDEFYDGLVVCKCKLVAELLEPLPIELILLLLEDVRHVELLELLVGEINEELLQRVGVQNLKPEDIQNPDALSSCAVLKIL